ncbi:type IV secretory system conjugative DNA transfer family protein [Streptomyces sp. NBC_01016]|uniref:type IV secretory system conjugative DNA transfer family protein n=1 Tax=Streptomyces sp. NBC_01016 TaxID=2903720 RepID=UPI00224CACDD|nr:type IV secretory system conjugative DNA transfer family protein [Streptomyces sp. NBC_01016]MCX4828359.1 type IV secretory system conjugative DNA transfer family protein [Streptomyces sp. NBC_01016]
MERGYHRDDREGRGRGGVPDGLLVGVLAFLLGMTILAWTATGLAGLFTKGAWPTSVTFANTPLAMRSLITRPHDIPGAWPGTPAAELSGYGLFWGLFIGQLMILVVLAVFVAGTVARWRAVRKKRRTQPIQAPHLDESQRGPGQSPETPTTPPVIQAPHSDESQRGPGQSPETATPPPATTPVPAQRGPVHLGPPAARHPLAMEAIQDAEGPVLVITSSADVWSETKDARAKLGPVLLYDPTHRCDTPARMHWNPAAGCTDKETAAARATALLAPIRPTAKLDSALAEAATTLLRSYLHAAAVDGKPFRHVHRWAQGTQVQDAVRILRTNPKAAAGTAGELEAALTSHPERRDMAQELTARALSSLFSVHIREACTPNRTDALTLDSFVNEGGTLYVVGEPIEDPKGQPGAMPLLTALASSVVEHGRRVAARSPAGRLDPPMTLVLDDVAAVAPLPQLPELLATGADQGLVTLALLRSREQGRTRWPDAELPLG